MYLTYDVGGTFIKYAMMDIEGNITHKHKVPTPPGFEGNYEMFLDIIVDIYNKQKSKYQIDGIAMSVPGQIDVKKGIVYNGGALPYLHNHNLMEDVSLKCDGKKVALENDAKCAALAEVWIGNAQGMKNAIVIVFGTGVGCGIVLDGKIHHGKGLSAGEVSFLFDSIKIHNVTGIKPFTNLNTREDFFDFPRGSWNGQVSVTRLRRSVANHKGLNYKDVSGEMIYEWAEQGDPYIIGLLEDEYLLIAKEVFNMYVLLAPDIILIGGGISESPQFIEGIRRYMGYFSKMSNIFDDIKLDVCKFNNDSNMIGALKNYIQLYLEEE